MNDKTVSYYPVLIRKKDETFDLIWAPIDLPEIYSEDIDKNYMNNLSFDQFRESILSSINTNYEKITGVKRKFDENTEDKMALLKAKLYASLGKTDPQSVKKDTQISDGKIENENENEINKSLSSIYEYIDVKSTDESGENNKSTEAKSFQSQPPPPPPIQTVQYVEKNPVVNTQNFNGYINQNRATLSPYGGMYGYFGISPTNGYMENNGSYSPRNISPLLFGYGTPMNTHMNAFMNNSMNGAINTHVNSGVNSNMNTHVNSGVNSNMNTHVNSGVNSGMNNNDVNFPKNKRKLDDKMFAHVDFRNTVLDIINDTKNNNNFLYETLNRVGDMDRIIDDLVKMKKIHTVVKETNNIIDPRYEIFSIKHEWILIKYPYNVKNINKDNEYFLKNVISYGQKYIVFIKNMFKWINFCLDNNIPKMEQHKHLSKYLMIKNFRTFFKTDDESYDIWNKYGYEPPFVYLNRKLVKHEVIYRWQIKDIGYDITYIDLKREHKNKN